VWLLLGAGGLLLLRDYDAIKLPHRIGDRARRHRLLHLILHTGIHVILANRLERIRDIHLAVSNLLLEHVVLLLRGVALIEISQLACAVYFGTHLIQR